MTAKEFERIKHLYNDDLIDIHNVRLYEGYGIYSWFDVPIFGIDTFMYRDYHTNKLQTIKRKNIKNIQYGKK